MVTRLSKILLLAAVAFLYTLIVFDNLTDFDSNYQFVRHVLLMDSTFPGNHGMWRAVHQPAVHEAFYIAIIAWEVVSTVLLWTGVIILFRALRSSSTAFATVQRIPVAALTLSMLMWLVAFLSIGSNWFLMWQSRLWNGQQAAVEMFVVVGIVLLIVLQPEREDQP